jgi:MFS family permease
MDKSKLSFGFIGIASTAVFLVLTIITIILHDSFSLLNSFITELGKYPATYLESTHALIFNLGLVIGGLLLSTFMIIYGIKKNTPLFVATSLLGVMTGVLIAAHGVITLNVAASHYVFSFFLFVSAALTCVLFIISTLRADGFEKSNLADILVAFASAVISIIFAVFIQIGNMPQILNVPIPDRIAVIPFTIIGWVALLLIFAFAALLAVRVVTDKTKFATKSGNAEATKVNGLKLPKFKTSKSKDRNTDI